MPLPRGADWVRLRVDRRGILYLWMACRRGSCVSSFKDRPAVRRMLQQGLVRPNELVDESYASRLQIQTDTERKLPRRRTSSTQVLLDRESVPSRN
eukprot:COSAG02_NODE_29438_length_569_cov_0.902128_1_plen_95_part_10